MVTCGRETLEVVAWKLLLKYILNPYEGHWRIKELFKIRDIGLNHAWHNVKYTNDIIILEPHEKSS